MAVQRLMLRIVKVADAVVKETDISDDDATLAYEIGLGCLRACVRGEGGAELDDEVLTSLFGKLPYKSDLMLKCQAICGVEMLTIPPLPGGAAIEAVKSEVEAIAAGSAKPNRKSRRAAKKG